LSRRARKAVVAATAFAVVMSAAAVLASDPPPASLRTRNVVLVTLDGVRIQEFFSGMDEAIAAADEKDSGVYDPERMRSLYGRPDARQRRAALLPYFWTTLAPQGIVLGHRAAGSRVLVTNPHLFSAPGYAEILTGRPQPDVISNDLVRYPHRTVLEYAKDKLGLGYHDVASIGSWEGFNYLASSRAEAFFTNGGYEPVPDDIATPDLRLFNRLQHEVMALWEEGRSDAMTFGIALEYLKTQRPRLLYIALGEPDDWAHARRYDRLLDALHVSDGYLKQLWETLQSMEQYRDATTMIVTTDHGRGVTPADWVEHDEGIAGSEEIWLGVFGPDTPHRGEVAPAPTVHQADVAATLLRFLGLDPAGFDSQAGPPVAAAFAGMPEAAVKAAGDDAAAEGRAAARVDALFEKYTRGGSPGAAVLVRRGDRVVHRKGYGLADLKSGEAIGPRTAFDLASVSKQFAAMAAMILHERGRLGYDDPVTRYLPELGRLGDGIAVRHLMTHTSGLPDYYDELEKVVGNGRPDTEDAMLFLAGWGKPQFAPGERYEYSNPGYEALALVVERASGQRFSSFLREAIFAPLGMNDTLVADRTAFPIALRARGYDRNGKGFTPDDDHPLNRIIGSGGIFSTLDDMLAWDRALESAPPVKAATLAEAFTPARLNDGGAIPYGFGWRLDPYKGHRRVMHGGSWVGFRTAIARYPDDRLSIIVLANLSDIEAPDLADAIAAIYLKETK